MKNMEIKVKIERKLFYDADTMFGIYGAKPLQQDGRLAINRYGNITIQGNSTKLIEGKEYKLILTSEKAPKNSRYDNYHEIVSLAVPKLDSPEKQFKYLSTIVTDLQYKTFEEAYAGEMIIDMIKAGDVELNKLRGIGENIIERIKEKAENQIDKAELIIHLSPLELSNKRINRIITHFNGVTEALDKVKQTIYNLTEVDGFGFKTVDTYALKMGARVDGDVRIRAAFKFALSDAADKEGHSWLDKEKLIEKVVSLTGLNQEDLTRKLDLGISKSIIEIEGRITLKKLFESEFEVYAHLKRLNHHYKKPNKLRSKLQEAITHAESSLGITYTEEQREAIQKAFNDGVFILNGGGGVGKTTVLRGIVEVWKSLEKTYHGCALSGKAANVLHQNGIKSSTIHRMLGVGGKNSYNRANPLPHDMVILDESSMVNAWLFNRLISSIKNGAMLIIVGDSGQLSGIGHGDILRDLLTAKEFNKVTLTKIHRQAADSGIIELASKFRSGESFLEYNQKDYRKILGINEDMVNFGIQYRPDVLQATKDVITSFKKQIKTKEDIMNFQILTARKSGALDKESLTVRDLNIYAQSIFNPSDQQGLKVGMYTYKVGDKVMAMGNTYNVTVAPDPTINNKLDIESLKDIEDEIEPTGDSFGDIHLYNGTMGLIASIDVDERKMKIKFEGIQGYVLLSEKDLESIELGYATTIHKSQGSTIPVVVVAIDNGAYTLLSQQLAYTAITRAKEKCVLISENKALHKAITTSSGYRNTFLYSFIEHPYYYEDYDFNMFI